MKNIKKNWILTYLDVDKYIIKCENISGATESEAHKYAWHKAFIIEGCNDITLVAVKSSYVPKDIIDEINSL